MKTTFPAQYEMYHLHVVPGLNPRDAARAFGVNTAAVYLAKHRVGKLIQREVKNWKRRRVSSFDR